MLFKSKRLILRKMAEGDIDIYNQWRNDIEVMYYTSTDLDVYNIEETKNFVTEVILGSQLSKCYLVIERKNNKPIGVVSLINIDYKNQNAECIIDIGDKEAWGKGYGTEAMKLLLDYAFLEMNLHRIFLRVFSFNERAIKLYERLGFQQEGIFIESVFRDGKWHDIIQMSILQNEYLNK